MKKLFLLCLLVLSCSLKLKMQKQPFIEPAVKSNFNPSKAYFLVTWESKNFVRLTPLPGTEPLLIGKQLQLVDYYGNEISTMQALMFQDGKYILDIWVEKNTRWYRYGNYCIYVHSNGKVGAKPIKTTFFDAEGDYYDLTISANLNSNHWVCYKSNDYGIVTITIKQ